MKPTTATKLTREQRRELFLLAAERIVLGKNTYSCIALLDAGVWDMRVGSVVEESHDYARLFMPVESNDPDVLEGGWLDEWDASAEEKREWRATALCFMAAMQ